VMGRYAGWIALSAGVAGGADVILIPEIPFSYESVCAKIQEREKFGKKFTIIIVAEGAREKDGEFVTSGAHTKIGETRLGGIGATVSAQIEKCTGKESRVCVLGHLQRGGSPTTFDRALCSIFGATAVELIAAGEFGKMVAFTGPQVGAIKLSDAVGKLKTVRLDGNLVRAARLDRRTKYGRCSHGALRLVRFFGSMPIDRHNNAASRRHARTSIPALNAHGSRVQALHGFRVADSVDRIISIISLSL